MSYLLDEREGAGYLLMGNDAIVRGALEAGIGVATAYPGTPSSDIIERLSDVSRERNIYVEWSVNEKVALEVAFAASIAGIRSICAMKQNGVNVASDFLLHLALSGTRGGMVLVFCEDPGALSSINEGESRHFAKMIELPLLEPGNFLEAREMTKWAFELSEELGTLVMLRSVTRLSHASGNVVMGSLPATERVANFVFETGVGDPWSGPVITMPVPPHHEAVQQRLVRARKIFEGSRFNTYTGPENPELLIITSSACNLYTREALHLLDAGDRVGILKLGTTWPLPTELIRKHLAGTDRVLFVEEVLPFMEENVKVLAAENAGEIGTMAFYGKNDGTMPSTGELNPDIVVEAVMGILSIDYIPVSDEFADKAGRLAAEMSPARDLTFCPGCPHRASFWSLHYALALDNRRGFVCGDIVCYTLGFLPCGFSAMKTSHSMGSGIGIASGFGKLGQFGFDQPVLAVCGDSTFFHAAMPALVNAVHTGSDVIFALLDNYGTAMTGFQPHPGTPLDAAGSPVTQIDPAAICRAMGAEVVIADPFDIKDTQDKLFAMLEKKGVQVIILRQICALSPEKKGKKPYTVRVDEDACIGANCGCGRFCTRIFRCPGLVRDDDKGVAAIDEVICAGCGVCADICPSGAIKKMEAERC
ncbi:MAG: indolepyruvate ferredoxin oxidoreductase [Chrysiogenales bacterium]|nr:MAG: indolepyruvate ferredoxin oxidoreductase [Chrysiogenales bacterium]